MDEKSEPKATHICTDELRIILDLSIPAAVALRGVLLSAPMPEDPRVREYVGQIMEKLALALESYDVLTSPPAADRKEVS